MADAVAPISGTTGPFDTASMQITLAQARAAAAHVNEVAFLEEVARTNEAGDAQALINTPPPPPDPFFNNPLLPNSDPPLDPTLNPREDLPVLSVFGEPDPDATISDSVKAQQLHDAAVLQHDAELLQQAANENIPLPLSAGAATVDLSPQAQSIVNETAVALDSNPAPISPQQLTQVNAILQPIADEPLTPALLQQIQAQLAAGQNSIRLSLNTAALALGFMAGAQPGPHQMVKNTVPHEDKITVTPVAAIDQVAIENGAIPF